MISEVLSKEFAFASDYFNTLLKEQVFKFPQSLVFEGMDIFGQIFFALELARILNCTGDKSQMCKCINCTWIKEGKHPAVIFVSQLDFKPQNDDTKTVISTKQVQEIVKTLEVTSDFHRVFIFLDAKASALDTADKEILKKYSELSFLLPEDNWKPSGLTYKTFHPKAPNALLKSVEEPPLRTSFIFLTKNREEIMQTIVSRSQTFKLPSLNTRVQDNSVGKFFENYPNISLEDAFEISQAFQNYLDTLSPTTVLDSAQDYFGELLKANLQNKGLAQIIRRDINLFTKAKKQLGASMSPKVVFDSLLIELSAEK